MKISNLQKTMNLCYKLGINTLQDLDNFMRTENWRGHTVDKCVESYYKEYMSIQSCVIFKRVIYINGDKYEVVDHE